MFILISADRDNLELCHSFYETREEATKAMVKEILDATYYESLEEIIEEADAGECGFSDYDAWVETSHSGTATWKIIEIPAHKSIAVDTPDGRIIAETYGAKDDYPGIWIFKDNNQAFNMMAAVEYNTSDKRFQIEGYQAHSDEPRTMTDYQTGEDLL